MNRVVVLLCFYLCLSFLYALDDLGNSDSGSLASIIIHSPEIDKSDLHLVNTSNNITVPIESMSRLFVKPGSYMLTCEQWGYYSFINRFDLKNGDVKEISVALDPIKGNLLRRFDNINRTKKLSMMSSAIVIGVAGCCKLLGDKTYCRYQTASTENEIEKYRRSSNNYQIAFWVSSSIGVGSLSSFIVTSIMGMNAKKKILQEMHSQTP